MVSEKDTVVVNYLNTDKKTVDFEPILVIDGEKVSVGTPNVGGIKVSAKIVEQEIQGEKTQSIRYKAKKRVRTVRGHRQKQTKLEITKIA